MLSPVLPFNPPRALEERPPSRFAYEEIRAGRGSQSQDPWLVHAHVSSPRPEPGFSATSFHCSNFLLFLTTAWETELERRKLRLREVERLAQGHRGRASLSCQAMNQAAKPHYSFCGPPHQASHSPIPIWDRVESVPASEEIKHCKLNEKIYFHILMKT